MRKDLRVLRDKIIDLHQSLQAVYPSHHWNHINVFQAYWNLVVFTESELGKFGFFNSLLRKGMDARKNNTKGGQTK